MKVLAAVWLGLVLGGCSTLQVDRARLAGVKRVAIGGFVVHQQVPRGFEIGNSGAGAVGWGSSLPRPNAAAQQMYENLRQTLGKEFKWTVAGLSAVAGNGSYRRFHDSKMKGLQSRPPLAAGKEAWGAEGVVDPFPVERMSLDERRMLLKSLGQDALAVARVEIHLAEGGGLKKLVGAGDYQPYAILTFALYDDKQEAPLWKDFHVVGERVEGVGHVLGATDHKALMKRSVEAAKDSYAKLIARFHGAG